MGQTLRIRPTDDEGRTVHIDAPNGGPPRQDGWVDLDKTWPSLHVILEALGVPEVDRLVEDEVSPEAVDAVARAVEPRSWESLFDDAVIEADDLPDPPFYVAAYYDTLRDLAVECAAVGAGWQAAID